MKTEFDWTIIGAGPAGITAIGNLIDSGVNAKNIAWIDPEFTGGDFATLWKNVSSNTSVKLFHEFYNGFDAYDYPQAPNFDIDSFNPKDTCQLKYAAEPLNWITQRLMQKVNPIKCYVQQLTMTDNAWEVQCQNGESVRSNNVVLAIGSTPSSLPFGQEKEIPLQLALDKQQLQIAVKNKKRVAVFGASHSAIILLRDLLEAGVPKVDNYYLGPLRYATFFDDWTLFDNTGLKGNTAKWARQNLHGTLPKGLTRYISNKENIDAHLSKADAIIFATGFKRRPFKIVGLEDNYDYNPHCGIIAPGLFGLGIAFPEKTVDRFGHEEMSVGLWKFMDYSKRVMPLWLQYGLVE